MHGSLNYLMKQPMQNRPLESNDVMMSHNDFFLAEFYIQKRSLFDQDDHLISRIRETINTPW